MTREEADALVAPYEFEIQAWINDRPNLVDGEWREGRTLVGVLALQSNDGSHVNEAALRNEVYISAHGNALQPDYEKIVKAEDLPAIRAALARRMMVVLKEAANTTPMNIWEDPA